MSSEFRTTYGIYQEPAERITRYSKRMYKSWLIHWHREIEIVQLLEGEYTYVIGNRKYEATAGDFIITKGCEPHQFCTNPPKMMQICKFDIGIVYNVLKKFNYPKCHITKDEIMSIPNLYDDLCFAFNKIGEIETNEGSNAICDCYTALLFTLLSENFPDVSESTVYDSESLLNFEKVLRYVEDNYSKELTLQILAEKVNYSDSYISILFRRYTGMSYKEYIDKVRVGHAGNYIRKGGKSFAEISKLCGFDTLRTFNNVFKRVMGCTPTEYKNAQIE